jgi:hypothetical protein
MRWLGSVGFAVLLVSSKASAGLTVGTNTLWAGAATFRVVVDLPARHRIGPIAFAALSRAADLATGLVFYRVAAIGSARGLSGFVTRAMRHELEREQLGSFLVELDEEPGVLPKKVLAQAKAAWHGR